MNTNYFLHDYYIILHLNREKRIDIIIDRTIALARTRRRSYSENQLSTDISLNREKWKVTVLINPREGGREGSIPLPSLPRFALLSGAQGRQDRALHRSKSSGESRSEAWNKAAVEPQAINLSSLAELYFTGIFDR